MGQCHHCQCHESLTSEEALDCFISESLRFSSPGGIVLAKRLRAQLPSQRLVPVANRWHVTTQDRLYHHLGELWGTKYPRAMIDLGSHASHGHFVNISDSLLFLDVFHAPGTLVVGVDAFEDFSLDLQRRFDAVEPYGSMAGVQKVSLTLAISERDGGYLDMSSLARLHLTCCADHWCSYARLERERKADHVCRITRMRLGILPPEPWLPSTSYSRRTIESLLEKKNTSQNHPSMPPRYIPRYMVKQARLDTLWRSFQRGDRARRVDFVKIDIDTIWSRIGGLDALIRGRMFSVLTIEVDLSWRRVSDQWGLSAVDQLAWLARRTGYATFLKMPCFAKPGCGSLETGRWKWNWKRRKYLPAPASDGAYAAWLLPLARPSAPFVRSGFHARRGGAGIQDLVLLDAEDAVLAELPARANGDCLNASHIDLLSSGWA